MFNRKKDTEQVIHGELEENFGEVLDSSEDQLKDTAKKYASRANNAIRNSADNIKNQIESNPLTCVAVAASTAFIIGFLLGRR